MDNDAKVDWTTMSSSLPALVGASNPFASPPGTSTELWQRLEARRPAPLRFALHLSRRPNAALCPCLQADLSGGSLTVTRILDPEHRVPYITLSPIFHAAGLTLVQGLLRFNLSPDTFDLSLAGLEPWDDFWVSLPLARSISASLGLSAALAAILDPRTSPAWSLDELEAGLSHNWRVPQENVDATAYSTDAITSAELRFDRVQLLPRGQQVRTLVSSELRSRIVREAEERRPRGRAFRLHQRLVRWSAQVVAVWQDVESAMEEERRVSAVLHDLREVVLAPTSTDVLEWLQLIAPQAGEDVVTGEQGVDERSLLAPLALAELSELRSTELPLGSLLLSGSQAVDEVVARLESVVRSKLACLHHMGRVALPLLASPSDDVTANAEQLVEVQRHPRNTSDTAPTVRHAPPTAIAAADAKRGNDEIARLDAKLDRVMGKLDRLVESQPEPYKGPGSAPQENETHREVAQARVQGLAHTSASTADQRTATAGHMEPLSTLHSFDTSPSLLVIIVAVMIAFIAIKSTVD